MDKLPSIKEFISYFDLPFRGYDNPIEFSDENFGFSISRDYLNGYASLIRIFIPKEYLNTDNSILPVWVSASYGKRSNGGIIISSSSGKIKKLFDPIDFESFDDFNFNIPIKKFTYKSFLKTKKIDAIKFLEIIDTLHKKPTMPIKGLWLKLKLIFWRIIIPNLFKFISWIFIKILYISSGTKFTRDIWRRIVFPDRVEEKEEKQSVLPQDNRALDFFGYTASAWIIFFYSCVHFLAYSIFFYYNIKPSFITTIFKNNFLTVIYIVITLSFFDIGLPRFLRLIIRGTDKLFHLASYKKIRI